MQAVCLLIRAGNREHSGFGAKSEFPVSWAATMSDLVFQRLKSAQTTTEGVCVSHYPCL